MIALPGLNPSFRSYGATPTRLPLLLTGIAPAGRCTRRPVTDDLSRLVKRLDGKGSRQGFFAYGWQSAAAAPAGPAPASAARIAAAIARQATFDVCVARMPLLNQVCAKESRRLVIR